MTVLLIFAYWGVIQEFRKLVSGRKNQQELEFFKDLYNDKYCIKEKLLENYHFTN